MIRLGIAVAVVLALLGGAFVAGYRKASSECEAEALKAQLAAMQEDVRIAGQVEARARAQAADIEAAAASHLEVIDELQTELAQRPAARRCPLDAADAERLRNIR